MSDDSAAWEARLEALWLRLDELDAADFVVRVEALTNELPAGSAVALFARACVQDSTGHPDQARPRYDAALAAGLTGLRHRRAAIQMASSLRNLGDPAHARLRC